MGILGHGHTPAQKASNKRTKPGSPNSYSRGSSRGIAKVQEFKTNLGNTRGLWECRKLYLECWALNRTPVSPPPSLREHHRREVRKDVRAGGWRGQLRKAVL